MISGSERPRVGASPPELNRRTELREQALDEARKTTGAPTNSVSAKLPDRAALDAQREKEIARIEAEVEAARKRHPQPPAGTASAPSNNSAASPSQQLSAQPSSSAVPAAPLTQSAAPQATASPAPSAASPSPNPSASAQITAGGLPAGLVAGPDGPTLTAENEKKARELLKENTIVIYSDNPAPQPILPSAGAAPRGSSAGSASLLARLALPEADQPQSAAPASTLTPDQEQKARDLLRNAMHQPGAVPAAQPPPPATPRSGVLPRPTPALDLPPGPGSSAAAAQTNTGKAFTIIARSCPTDRARCSGGTHGCSTACGDSASHAADAGTGSESARVVESTVERGHPCRGSSRASAHSGFNSASLHKHSSSGTRPRRSASCDATGSCRSLGEHSFFRIDRRTGSRGSRLGLAADFRPSRNSSRIINSAGNRSNCSAAATCRCYAARPSRSGTFANASSDSSNHHAARTHSCRNNSTAGCAANSALRHLDS